MKTLKELFYKLVSEGLSNNPVIIEKGEHKDKNSALQEFRVYRTLKSAIIDYNEYAENYKVVEYHKCSIDINGRSTDKIGIRIKLRNPSDKIELPK